MAYCNLGSALRGKRELDAAIHAIKKAIELQPDYAVAYCNLGTVLKDKGKLDATVDAITEAGLRDGLSLMVGGAAASELLSEKSGCDFYGKTAVDGLNFARQVTEG